MQILLPFNDIYVNNEFKDDLVFFWSKKFKYFLINLQILKFIFSIHNIS